MNGPRGGGVRVLVAVVVIGVGGFSAWRGLGRSTSDAVSMAVMLAVMVLVYAALIRRAQRREGQARIGTTLTRDQWDEACRASTSGPVPTDPMVRHEAIRLILVDRSRIGSARAVSAVFVIAAVIAAVAAVLMSPWWWVLAALALLAIARILTLSRSQADRLAQLRSVPPV